MRRTAVGFVVIALLLAVSTILAQGWPAVRAQEASPVAEEEAFALPPGVTAALLAQLAPIELPETPAALVMLRLTVEPETEVPVHPHPGLEIALIEAGSVTIRTEEGPAVQVVRGGAAEEAMPESVGPGEELTLAAGDIGLWPAGNLSGGRAGEEGVTVLVFEFAAQAMEATPEA